MTQRKHVILLSLSLALFSALSPSNDIQSYNESRSAYQNNNTTWCALSMYLRWNFLLIWEYARSPTSKSFVEQNWWNCKSKVVWIFSKAKKKHHKSTHLNQKHTRCSNNFPFLNIISLKFDFWANNKLFNRYSTIQWFCCLAIWRNFCAFLVERVFMSFSNLILFSRRTKSRNFANNIFQRILLAFFFLFHTNFCISKCVLSHFVPKNKKTEWQNHFSDFNGASHFLFLFCEKAILHFD